MKTVSLIITSLFCTGVATQAAVIAQYDFTAVTDPNESTETFLSSSIDSNPVSTASVITSPATHNSGTIHPGFGDVFDNGGDQAIGWSARGNNPSQNFQIIAPVDTYFSFDVTLSSPLSLTSLSLVSGVNSSIGGTTAFDYTLSYSTDGTNFSSLPTIISGSGTNQAATVSGSGIATSSISFDLSGVSSLQNVSGQVFFQLDPVASSGAAQNGVQSQRGGFIDDVTLDAIPEPSSSSLVLIGGLALLARRRR